MPTTVSKPIILDETGQAIAEAIADIAGVPSPAVNYLKDATTTSSTLTLEKRDGTTITFSPSVGGADWSAVTNKPFNSIDTGTLKVENNVLKVNTTTTMTQDNTQPITSGGVYTVVGNINALLETI